MMNPKDADDMENSEDPDQTAPLEAVRPRGNKTFFMLNSVEHEILNAHKCENIKKFSSLQAQIGLECYFPCSQILKCQQLLAF